MTPITCNIGINIPDMFWAALVAMFCVWVAIQLFAAVVFGLKWWRGR